MQSYLSSQTACGSISGTGRRCVITMGAILFVAGTALSISLARPVNGAELLDEPVAVVGSRVILRSELEAQITLMALQTKRNANRASVRDSLAPALLEQMINDELILIEAERDTMLSVSQEELDAALAQHIESLRGQFASDEEFQSELAREGMTERDLRVRYRREVGNQLLKQKLIQRKLGEVGVSNGEVREFYTRYQDSLPVQPEGIKLAHILMVVGVSDETQEATRTQATRILQEIQDGLSFPEAAKRYSQDLTAESGGDLGWFGPGDMVPSFEQAAFGLAPGQISGVVRTRYGFHLIECVEKAGGRVHARHLLLSLNPSHADSVRVFQLADSVGTLARADADAYCGLAQTYSVDEESQKNCGELGWYPVAEMFPEFKAALADADIGAVIGPVWTQFGWHVLRVLDRREARAFNLTDDWDGIREMARREKTNRVVYDWIREIRKDTHVDVRPLSAEAGASP